MIGVMAIIIIGELQWYWYLIGRNDDDVNFDKEDISWLIQI